jgi:hypothetical protein
MYCPPLKGKKGFSKHGCFIFEMKNSFNQIEPDEVLCFRHSGRRPWREVMISNQTGLLEYILQRWTTRERILKEFGDIIGVYLEQNDRAMAKSYLKDLDQELTASIWRRDQQLLENHIMESQRRPGFDI